MGRTSSLRTGMLIAGGLIACWAGSSRLAWLVAEEKGASSPPAAAAAAEGKAADAGHAEGKHADDKAAATKASGDHASEGAKTGDAHGAAAAGHGAGEPAADHGGGGHGGGHHDPTDLGHQNSGPSLEDPSQWKSDLAICTLAVFLCLLALLSKFAWRPVMDGLEARERAIATSIEDARKSAEQAASQLRMYEAKLAAATEESRGILEQARKDADAARERIVAEAQEVAQRERQRALDDIAAAKTVALQEMTQKSVDLAVGLAGRLIHQKLRPEDHAQLIREMVEQFPSRN